MREKHEGNSGGNFEGNNEIRELRPFIESQLVGERRKKSWLSDYDRIAFSFFAIRKQLF